MKKYGVERLKERFHCLENLEYLRQWISNHLKGLSISLSNSVSAERNGKEFGEKF